MGNGVRVRIGEHTRKVDGRDVALWAGVRWEADRDGWERLAEEYVAAHPRPSVDTGSGVAAAQRLAVLRRLAAGPATRDELLAAVRTVGWVGADDLENRLRDVRAADRRAGVARLGLPLAQDGERLWLDEPFALLDEDDRRALGFAKMIVGHLDGPLARSSAQVLDGLAPGVAAGTGARVEVRQQAAAGDFHRFFRAYTEARPVRVRYFSLNSGREQTYTLVPREFVTLGAAMKAVCVPVDSNGERVDIDRQFALDRLRTVEDLPGWPAPEPAELELRKSRIVLEVSEGLFEVMRERRVFGVSDQRTEQRPDGSYRVRGTFHDALSWDVMEQLCAWSGSAQVREPLWLVNAVCRRLRAGLRVMEEGADLTLVKPEPGRQFADIGDAVGVDQPLPERSRAVKLAPPE